MILLLNEVARPSSYADPQSAEAAEKPGDRVAVNTASIVWAEEIEAGAFTRIHFVDGSVFDVWQSFESFLQAVEAVTVEEH